MKWKQNSKIKKIKIPNLYIISTLSIIIALLLLAYTKIHFVIVFMIFSGLLNIINALVASHFGYKVSVYLKENEPELYRKYNSNFFNHKGVFLISPKAYKSKEVLEKLDEEYRYALKKYAEAYGNAIYTFFLIVFSMLYASYFILN